MVPYLNAIPAANGPAVGGGLATHTFAFDQELDQDYAQGRVDYQAGAHQIFGRYTYDDAAQRLPTDYPPFPRSYISTNQFATVEYRINLSLTLEPHSRARPRGSVVPMRIEDCVVSAEANFHKR